MAKQTKPRTPAPFIINSDKPASASTYVRTEQDDRDLARAVAAKEQARQRARGAK